MAEAIDKLFIKIGLDPSELSEGIQRVTVSLAAIDGQVRNFGQGMEMGLREAESASKALKETGDVGEKGMKKVADGAQKAGARVGGLAAKVKDLAKNLIAPIGGAMALGKIFTGYLSQADRLGKFAESIGESITDIDAWGQAAGLSGGSAEDLNATIQGLTKSIVEVGTLGTGRAKAAFEELGINAKDSSGNIRKATDVLMELAGQSETMDKMQFVGLLTKMGIDQGTIMLLQTGKKSVQELVAQMKDLSYTEKDAEVAAKFNDSLQLLGKNITKMFAPLLQKLIPVMNEAVTALAKLFKLAGEHGIVTATVIGAVGVALSVKYAPAALVAAKATGVFTAALLKNPLTWLIGIIIIAGLVLEDLIVWLQGGESELDALWVTSAGVGDKLYDFVQWIKALGKEIWAFFEGIGQFWGDALFEVVKIIEGKVLAAFEKVKGKAKEILDIISAPGDKMADLFMGAAGEVDQSANLATQARIAQMRRDVSLDQSRNVQASTTINNNITATTNDPAALAGLAGDATNRAMVNTFNGALMGR